jgi:Cu-processing system permease protein
VIGALLRFELAAARRARTVPLFAVGFAAASLAVAVVGLSAGGAVRVQGFARTSVSLLQLVVWVVPLLALLTGAVAGAECLDLEFVVGLPIARPRLLLARWAAWTLALGAALLIGFGAAGLAIALLAGGADGGRYVALTAVACLLLSAMLAVGLAIGVASRTRARAVGIAIVVWFLLVVGVDLLAIGVLAILPPREAGWGLSLLLLADPADAARALGLGLFQADAIAGPTGAALRRVLGGWGAWLLVAGLAAWTALPLYVGGRRFAHRDL